MLLETAAQTGRRLFLRSPLFTAAAIITISAGVGAATAIFSVVNGVLLKPLPYDNPEQLVGVWHTAPGIALKDLNMAPATYFVYRDETRTMTDVAMYRRGSASVTGLGDPEQVLTLNVTDGALPILGVRPLLGRVFARKDDTPGSPETVILTYGYWQRKFGGDRNIIGRRIVVDAKAREVIGVLPQSFRFLDLKPLLVLPLQIDRNKTFIGNFSFVGLARLKPGVTLAQANTDVARMLKLVPEKFPPPPGFSNTMFEQVRIGPQVRPFEKDLIGDVGGALCVLMGTVGIVLLIACANVANLLLVRAEGRQQELAIRSALGASWSRIARELLLESVALALLGGALGLALAWGAVKLLLWMAPAGLPRLDDISIDARVLLFALGVSVLSGLLFGLVPVLKYAAPAVQAVLPQGGRNFSQGRERHRAQRALVAAQVALALVLSISSGLMVRSLFALERVAPGFTRPEHVQVLRITIPEALIREPESVARAQQEILRKIGEIPGVRSAAMSSSIPMDGINSNDVIFAEDRAYAAGELPPIRRFKFVSPGFFDTIGDPIIAGRDLNWTDIYEKRPIGLISENFAREYWGSPQKALGKRIREGPKDDWREIIGIVGDQRDDGASKKAPTTVYWPLLITRFWGNPVFPSRFMGVAIRTDRAGTGALVDDVRRAVWAVNPDLPVALVQTLADIERKSMARVSFTLVMLSIAAGMALLLGVVGVYGVISYSLSRRTREIGIRMALGASRERLVRMFVAQATTTTALGVAAGLAAAAAATRLMEALLFGVSPFDIPTYAAVAVLICAVAVLASYFPSRRAASAAPLEALRVE
jgi:putative ABC transport system permease protein